VAVSIAILLTELTGFGAVALQCTNATSVDIEDLLYRTAATMGIKVMTVSQRPALVRHHQQELHLSDGRGDWILRELHTNGDLHSTTTTS
jgi:ABC-type uncharacterized transport system fused permease/ATPase subunit